MANWLNELKAWWNRSEDDRRLFQMARYWAKQGAVAPYMMAEKERWFRLKLEEFRNFASRRYLEDQTLTQAEIADEWIADKIASMLKSSFCREDGLILINAIKGMGIEMFHGAALEARKEESRAMMANAKEHSPAIKQKQSHTAFN